MGKKMQIDFTGVDKEIRKGGGKGKHIPEGDYLVKIIKHEVRKSERTGGRYINWQFQVASGENKGATVYGSTSLKPEALWSLRNLIHAALGKNVAGKAVNFDPENLYGKLVGASVEDNVYKKDDREVVTSQVSTCFPKDELGAEEADEEEDDSDEEEVEVEEEDDEDLEDVDVEDL
jgi:hypothetical protein